jgi:hypothetical protein
LARPCRDAAEQGEAKDPPPCGSVEDVLAVLRDDYRRAYFLTGTGLLQLAAFFHLGLVDHGGCRIAELKLIKL